MHYRLMAAAKRHPCQGTPANDFTPPSGLLNHLLHVVGEIAAGGGDDPSHEIMDQFNASGLPPSVRMTEMLGEPHRRTVILERAQARKAKPRVGKVLRALVVGTHLVSLHATKGYRFSRTA